MRSKAGTQDVKWCPQAGPVGVLAGVLVGVFVRGRVFVCLFPGACSFGCVGVSVWLCVGVSVWLCVGVLVGVRACLCLACVRGVCVRVSFCGCVRLRAFACACVFVCVRVCPSLGPARDPSGFSRRGKDWQGSLCACACAWG